IFDRTFTIRQRLDTFPVDGFTAAQGNSSHYVVVRDVETLGALDVLQKEAYAEGASSQQYLYGFDVDADETMQSAVGGAIASRLKEEGVKCRIECRADELEECYALYGGLFFLGIFLGLLFLMATVLIIYYKQISEGFDDKARFEIMQKVGMRRDEVKSAIRSQVLTVFFLPLVAACVHIAFAFPMITRLLSMLNLTNVVLFAGCTAGSMLAFGLFYAIVYGWTAKVYYRIIA
ncbi:MAG: FtsX-like permease family protein, partial [Clostridia bacterium]